jgi:hypothetical protein
MKELVFHSAPAKVRVTVMGRWDEESQSFYLTTSRCSKKDQFIKKRGVLIARSRMEREKYYNVITYPLTTKEFIEEAKVISDIIIKDATQVKAFSNALIVGYILNS